MYLLLGILSYQGYGCFLRALTLSQDLWHYYLVIYSLLLVDMTHNHVEVLHFGVVMLHSVVVMLDFVVEMLHSVLVVLD